VEEGRHGKYVDHEVCDDIDDGLGDEGWAFVDAVAVVGEEFPVAAYRPARVSMDDIWKLYGRVLDTLGDG